MTTTDGRAAGIVAPLEETVRAHAPDGERLKRLPSPIVEALRSAGLFRMMVPHSLGGREAEPQLFFKVVEKLAALDGSTAWCLFIAGGGVITGAYLPDESAEEIFGDPATIIGGSTFPPGKAAVAEGGYMYSGHWAYASGCQHTNWMLAVGIVSTDGAPRLTPAGTPEMRVAFVPTERAHIIENWDVMGLTGTGSHDFELTGEYVPGKYTFALGQPVTGRHYQGPLYRLPFLALFGYPIAAVALGIAQGAIDTCMDLAQVKVPRGGESTLRDRAVFHYQLADAVATLEAGRAWMYGELDAAWQRAQAGEGHALEQRARLQLAANNAVRSAAAATELMYAAGGATANFRSSPLQKALRDVHATTQHFAVSRQSAESAGRMLAGLPAPNPMLLL